MEDPDPERHYRKGRQEEREAGRTVLPLPVPCDMAVWEDEARGPWAVLTPCQPPNYGGNLQARHPDPLTHSDTLAAGTNFAHHWVLIL